VNLAALASLDDIESRARAAWRPPARLSLSEWADRRFYLSAESSAAPGRWKTLPYQREIMDALTDPETSDVVFMKSARLGWTKILGAWLGYTIDHDPCSFLFVQPTVDDAKEFSKEEIATMLRDCPEIGAKVHDAIEEEGEGKGPRDSGNTIKHKKFPGGVLSLVGANSGAGFRRISRKRIACDEVDAYPPSAGSDGDPVELAKKRSEYFWDRKNAFGSTPLIEAVSRIQSLFLEGSQEFYEVPCPHCGHFDRFVLTEREDKIGHFMRWPDGRPLEAFFVCSKNGCVIEHSSKFEMVERGRWVAKNPSAGKKVRSFHLWSAYSFSPGAAWGLIAEAFLKAKRAGPEKFQTFVNTWLGETWKEQGEAPAWDRLYHRREKWQIGTVPDGVKLLTAGVDVQKDRLVVSVKGWAPTRENWTIDAFVIPCNTALESSWLHLDEVLGRTYETSSGPMQVALMAIDSGYQTQAVYNFARTRVGRVIATKGVTGTRALVGSPTDVDVLVNGRTFARGAKVWPVGVDGAKTELYGWLWLDPIVGGGFPPGYCHHPELGEDFFKELTAEHQVATTNRRGYKVIEWQVIPGRQNHYLDAEIAARVAASVKGIDRLAAQAAPKLAPPAAPAPKPVQPRRPGGFLGPRSNWLGRR
jgi:phage terminase large subunit GpA-like protein